MTDHVSPQDDRLTTVLAADDGAPVVMLNMNRYRERASYADGSDGGTTGREAYLRYGIVAIEAIAAVGGRILWSCDAEEVVIGCDHDRYDEIVAVWYPSRGAFLRLAEHPGYLEAHTHREAAIEQATLIACDATAEPVLGTPYPA